MEMDKVYERSLRKLRFGRPIYHADAPGLKPGHCGYFDNFGKWQDFFDLASEIDGLPKPAEGKRFSCGPICGYRMKWTDISTDIATKIPGTPAGIEYTFSFQAERKESALLLAAPMKYTGYSTAKPFIHWIKNHVHDLFTQSNFSDDIRRHGLYLVTQAYRTSKCTMVIASQKGQDISMSLSAEAFDAAHITGKGKWGSAQGCSLSKSFDTAQSDDDEVTIFAGGLRFRPIFFDWIMLISSTGFDRGLLSGDPVDLGIREDEAVEEDYMEDPEDDPSAEPPKVTTSIL